MRTKDIIYIFLDEHRDVYSSGEELAQELSVSRTAVWKAINSLRKEGCTIDAVQNKGYRLSGETDILSIEGIRKFTNNSLPNIYLYKEVSSTNDVLKEMAANGAPEGTVVIADSQTAGKGRRGRSFYSPSNSGLYLSLLLRPIDVSHKEALRFTRMAALAACEAIEEVSGLSAGIKWVNDIFIDQKKVCGILTEGSFGLESGNIEYVIVGIGINAYTPKDGFPEELKNIAGSVFPKPHKNGKNNLAAGFLDRFIAYYTDRDYALIAKKYRKRSILIGKEVEIITPSKRQQAQVMDIDNECRLIVRYDDGRTEALSSAEVSIGTV